MVFVIDFFFTTFRVRFLFQSLFSQIAQNISIFIDVFGGDHLLEVDILIVLAQPILSGIAHVVDKDVMHLLQNILAFFAEVN
jgi:hypothetical protein